MDDIVVITLFRHGMTEANKRRAYLGWSDSPLCSEAIKQLNNHQLQDKIVFSSDLGRCAETAKILFPSQTPEWVPELREMNFGEWEGRTYEELAMNTHYQNWIHDFYSHKPPSGESYTEFTQRVGMGWTKVTEKTKTLNENNATIITHGGVIKLLLSKFAPEQRDFWDWSVPHGNGYQLVWQKDIWRRGERCTLLREVPLMAKLDGSIPSTN